MKITTTSLMIALVAALPIGNVNAGDYSKAPAVAPPIAAAESPFYGSVSVGYESTYLFRGVDFGDNAPWGSIDVGANIAEGVTLDAGAWYINPTERGFVDELDLYAWLSFPMGPLSASIGATWYYFPEGGGDALEPGITIGYDVMGYVEISLGYYYDLNADGSYIELGASKSIPITDSVSLEIGGGISYADNYYGINSFNHAFVTAGPSISLTERASLDIYIGGNFPLDDLADAGEDDDIHGGASITVEF